MTRDLKVTIMSTGASKLQFVAPDPDVPDDIKILATNRPKPRLDPEALRLLRLGQATPAHIAQLQSDLRKWLGKNFLEEIGQQYTKAKADATLFRLVFSARDDVLTYLGSDLPMELLNLSPADDALSLRPDVIIGHVPLPARTFTPFAGMNDPLRILIVRSSPQTLGEVPPAAALGAFIQTPAVSNGFNVDVQLLTSEAGASAAGAPTYEKLEACLTAQHYDIVVYLGHGLLKVPNTPNLPAMSYIVLEDEPNFGKPYDSTQVAALFQRSRNKRPLLLLIGCLTAAAVPPGEASQVDNSIQGLQGLAQQLLRNTEIAVAVGMRSRLDGASATLFLETLFAKLLLQARPGYVEAAVSAARTQLVGQPWQSWCAPTLFSIFSPSEPLLGSRVNSALVPLLEAQREGAWDQLQRISPRFRTANTLLAQYKNICDGIKSSEETLRDQVVAANAMLMPGTIGDPPIEEEPGAEVTLPIRLIGNKGATEIKVWVSVDASGLGIEEVTLNPDLTNDFEMLDNITQGQSFNRASWSISPKDPMNPVVLPDGPLVFMKFRTTDTALGRYNVQIEKVVPTPNMPVYLTKNAVIVPVP